MKKTRHTGIYYRMNKDGSKTYYLRLIINNRQTWTAAGPLINHAKDLWRRYKIGIADGNLGIVRPKRADFKSVASRYFEHYKSKSKERNWPRVESIIKILNSFFGNIEISKITTWTIDNYIKDRKKNDIKPGTINVELDYMRAILNKAIEWKFLKTALKIKRLPVDEHRARILEDHEIDYILQNVSEDHRDAIMLALDTGMRLGEIFSLGPENIDFRRRILHLDDTKSRKPRSIPLTLRAAEILKRRFKEFDNKIFKEKNVGRISYIFTMERKRLKKQLKSLPSWRFHDLRHTFVTRLLQKCNDPYTVMQLAGHHDLEMTTRYLHTDEKRKRAAIATLERE